MPHEKKFRLVPQGKNLKNSETKRNFVVSGGIYRVRQKKWYMLKKQEMRSVVDGIKNYYKSINFPCNLIF
jgi:hypothetical protein